MNVETWNKLTDVEIQEVNLLSKQFIASVMGGGTLDGWDFCNKFEVREIDDRYCVG